MTKHIGFTGTQKGMTKAQREAVWRLLLEWDEVGDMHGHHGDCIGADAQFGRLLHRLGWDVIIHPPIKDNKRAFCAGVWRTPLPYLDRNRAMVDECELLIAAPKGAFEERRSGTWSTVRYARKRGKEVIMVYPTGEVIEIHPDDRRPFATR